MILVRLLLLAFVVIGAAPPSVASAASSAPADGPSGTGNEGGGDALALSELGGCCAGCLADPDEAARPLEHVLPNPSNAQAYASISDPFTEERVRPPFRPPMAR